MQDDLNASEKRLIAALDRIDDFIDRTAAMGGAALAAASPETGGEAVADLVESRARNQRLSDELAALRASHSSTVAGFEARLQVLNDRLLEAEARAVELAGANDALSMANRVLIGTEPAGQGDAIRRALEAEVESLRAARQAERGKLGEIMDSLDRMLGIPVGPAPILPVASDLPELAAEVRPKSEEPAMVHADAAAMSEMSDERGS